MDKLRNVIKGKTNRSLDRMVKTTDSPFMLAVPECPVSSKFCLPQLKPFNGMKDLLDHLNTFKTTLGLQQSPDEILCRSFPTTLKGAARKRSRSYQHCLSITLSSWAIPSYATSSGDNTREGQQTTYLPLDKEKMRP